MVLGGAGGGMGCREREKALVCVCVIVCVCVCVRERRKKRLCDGLFLNKVQVGIETCRVHIFSVPARRGGTQQGHFAEENSGSRATTMINGISSFSCFEKNKDKSDTFLLPYVFYPFYTHMYPF